MTGKRTARAVGSSARGGGENERRLQPQCITTPAPAQPVYADTGRIVGEIRDGEFRKRIKSTHILTRPPALANDLKVLAQLQAAKVERLAVTNAETGTTYVTNWETWQRHSFPVNRSGYGPQRALPLGWWSVNGAPPALAAREPDPDAPRQLPLFVEAGQ